MTHYRWDDLPKERLNEKLERRFIHGERGMISQIWLAKGSIVPTHTHEAEQISYIVDGHLRLWVDEKVFDVRTGEVLVIPSGVPHRAEAILDTYDMDIFAPPRRDWIEGRDAYLRGGGR
ncbi:MAG TPA: cupin domain-containing protein [Candidatus Limnocylindria bacterium]|nr:cupin domain-containing protein [Candidatus Limnocylindria bacterium]